MMSPHKKSSIEMAREKKIAASFPIETASSRSHDSRPMTKIASWNLEIEDNKPSIIFYPVTLYKD
jgi:hypothetical protein